MIRWMWVFLDRPAAAFDDCVRFWSTVTGSAVSAPRGEHGEFVTLLPPAGTPWLKLQAVGDAGGVHLDLDVDDIPVAIDAVVTLGGRLIGDRDGYAVMESPAGQTFCLTPFQHAAAPDATGTAVPPVSPPFVAPDGTASRVDQVCLDLAAGAIDGDRAFWSALTGRPATPSPLPEFTRLRSGFPFPLDLLIQRLDAPRPAGAHPDLSSTDPAATAAWHESLGATRVSDGDRWIVLRDPGDALYCVTSRDPYRAD
ncbi:VOC family protein [Nocardia thailandica]|uniref:VOC family protein n=1 Tax=Nocardia thailandica TaxID=257275 RepID=A0ABW6PQ55_9NOCA